MYCIDQDDQGGRKENDVQLFLFNEPCKVVLGICILGVEIDLIDHDHHPGFQRHDDQRHVNGSLQIGPKERLGNKRRVTGKA